MVPQAVKEGSAVPSKEPNPGAPASENVPPETSTGEDQANRNFWIQSKNLALLAVCSLPIYILLDIYFGAWAANWTFGTAAGSVSLAGLLKIVTWARNLKPISPYLEDLINRIAEPLRKPRITPYFGIVAVIVLPWSIIDWSLHNNFPVLMVLPGPDLADLLDDTEVDTKKTYEILVRIGHETGNIEERRLFPRNASSIDIGASTYYLDWREQADSALSDQEMSRLLRKLNDDGLRDAWKDNPRLLSTPRLKAGDRVQIIFRCRGGKSPLFEPVKQKISQDQPRRKAILLEPEKSDEFFSKAAECETVH